MIKAGEVSSTSYVEIPPFSGTKSVMDQLTAEKFLVVKDDKGFQGIVTLKDYVRKPHSLIIDCIDAKPRIDFEDDLGHALSILKESKQTALPVFKEEEFHGVFSVDAVFSFVSEQLLKNFSEAKGEAAIQATRTLVAGLGHDFRNLLNVIIGGITISLQQQIDNPEMIQALQSAERASLAAKNLCRHLLSFARAETPKREVVDLVKLMRESISFYTINSQVTPTFHLESGPLPVSINIDHINQIISNITINAIQAMPEGGALNIRLRRDQIDDNSDLPLQPGEYACLEFEDSGIGIHSKYRNKIFDPNFTTKPKGSGLGLSIAYNILLRYDGHITVESQIGKGANFKVYLPVADISEALEIKQETNFTKIEKKSKQKNVLVMDDNPEILKMLEQYLSHLGHRVKTATSSAETLYLFKEAIKAKSPFDMVLLDLVLPGDASGEQVMRTLLEIDPNAKGFITSGYPDHEIMLKCREKGFAGSISKPFALVDLKAILDG